MLRGAASGQREARRVARKLVTGIKDPWARIKAIRDYVALNVRGAGPAFTDLPFSAVTEADRVLRDGYGNLADRSVLLFAMLRAAGFSPEFVLGSRRPAIDAFRESLDAAPEAAVFRDVLVRLHAGELDLPPDRHLYLGDTDQYGSVGASGHAGMWALMLDSGTIAPLLPAKDERGWTDYTMSVAADGDVDLTVRRLVFGSAFGYENRRYTEMTPEERRRHYEELLGGFSQAAEATSELETDFTGYPGRIQFSVRMPGYATRDNRHLYFALPESLAGVLKLRTERRDNPLMLSDRGEANTRFTVRLPKGFDVDVAPPSRAWRGIAGLDVDMSVGTRETRGGDVLVVESKVSKTQAIADPGTYSRLVEWDREMSHAAARTVILRATEK